MDAVAIETLLAAARTAGLTVRVEGERLRIRGPRQAEPLALALLARKREVLAVLRAQPGAPLLVPRPCARCGWPTTVGPRCLRCRHGAAPACRACGSRAWWRPHPATDPAYAVCRGCHPPPDAPPARQAVAADPPPAPPSDRQGHRRCLCGCGALLPPGTSWHAAPGAAPAAEEG